MPARRDMHTGHLNFMHRPWGPLEPFDNSYTKFLSQNGTYSHIISDHLHYFEDGGWGYATAFDSWEFIRGQEYDSAKVMVESPVERLRANHNRRSCGGMDGMQGQITSIEKRTATEMATKEDFSRMEHDLRTEIRENTKAVDDLSESVRGQAGFATEIDLLMSRMTIVEQSLGIKRALLSSNL